MQASKDVLCAFTWSPHTTRLTQYSGVPFYWLPFAVDMAKFGDLSKYRRNRGYRYDFGFTGSCDPNDYPSRAAVCRKFPEIAQQGIKLTPNLLLRKHQEQMKFGESSCKLLWSTQWLSC